MSKKIISNRDYASASQITIKKYPNFQQYSHSLFTGLTQHRYIWRIIPIPKNNAILPMRLQLLSNNNDSVMFVRIIGINPKYIIPLSPTPYSLFPTPYSQGDVAKLLRNGIIW